MSVSKSKNLERKLDNFAKEAKNELNNVCGSSLWESLGFVFFDQLEDSEKIAKANFYLLFLLGLFLFVVGLAPPAFLSL